MTAGLQLLVEARAHGAALERLAAVLAVHDVPVVQLVPAPGETLSAQVVLPFVAVGQEHGAAVLLTDHAELARTVRADGVHLTGSDDVVGRYATARDILGTRFIVGADARASRHDAMLLGEAGADYVAFGLANSADDHAFAADVRLDLVTWWADIFEPPVVAADAVDVDEAGELAAAGADFVAVALPMGLNPANSVAFVAAALAAIGPPAAIADRGEAYE
ncbi:MAG: thiamine phosphate synthase [Hyphomicrobiaceae bacterium]|nr:thiamine phosphate synthase [Hyphomicrobiaceae bacterium]